MKPVFLFLSLLLCVIAGPVFAELTSEDLDKIRLIVNEANTPIKTDVAWLRGKMDTLDKQISYLMVLIVAVVAIPQIVIAWRSRKDRSLGKQIEVLTREIKTLRKERYRRER